MFGQIKIIYLHLPKHSRCGLGRLWWLELSKSCKSCHLHFLRFICIICIFCNFLAFYYKIAYFAYNIKEIAKKSQSKKRKRRQCCVRLPSGAFYAWVCEFLDGRKGCSFWAIDFLQNKPRARVRARAREINSVIEKKERK